VSSTLAGAALGSLSGGSLSDSLGRRKGLLVAAVPMLMGPLLSAGAQVGRPSPSCSRESLADKFSVNQESPSLIFLVSLMHLMISG